MKAKKDKGGIRHFQHSSLEAHRRQGKQLIAPMMQLPNRQPVSWLNDRLPEVLWMGLVLEACSRDDALRVFRLFCESCALYRDHEAVQAQWDITFTALSTMPANITQNIGAALDHVGVPRSVLSPLLLFPDLPGHERWAVMIPALPDAKVPDAWQGLALATANLLDHQSQPSTDIRWITIMFKVVLGKVMFRRGADDDFVEALRLYPNHGDMAQVRPSIRSLEIAFRSGADGQLQPGSDWCQSFWKQAMDRTLCRPVPPAELADQSIDRRELASELERARHAVMDHWAQTLTTTGLDSRHDTAFGLTLYALACLMEIGMGLNGRIITGRLLVRTLTEIRIILAFLHCSADPGIWQRFRSYGAGQAKLAFLKYEMAAGDKPGLVTRETLESLANEDLYQEFVNIDLGSWSGSDLRKMAEQSGTKVEYDRYYGWTSTFVHGHWPAVRDAVFATCLNPLHRLHRVPMPAQRRMEDCARDAVALVNGILATLGEIYPEMTVQLSFPADPDETPPHA